MQMTMREWAMLIFLSIIWGGAFFFAAVAVIEVPPLTVVFFRVAIAAFALFIYLRIRGDDMPNGRTLWVAFFVLGLVNNIIPFSLLFWAMKIIPSGLASILNATTPIFSIIVAHFMLADEKMELNKVFGVILGLIGVAVLVGGDAFSGSAIAILGMVACLGAALSYAFAVAYARRFKAMGVNNSMVAFGQLTASTLIMLPIMLVVDQPWKLPVPSSGAIAALITLALVSTALAYVIYFRILSGAGAVNAALVTLLVPASAILLGTMFLGEVLEPRHYAGLALILSGLIAVDGRLLHKFTTR